MARVELPSFKDSLSPWLFLFRRSLGWSYLSCLLLKISNDCFVLETSD